MRKNIVMALWGISAALCLWQTPVAYGASFILEGGARVAVEPFTNAPGIMEAGVNPGELAAMEASYALQQSGVTAFYHGTPTTTQPIAPTYAAPQPKVPSEDIEADPPAQEGEATSSATTEIAPATPQNTQPPVASDNTSSLNIFKNVPQQSSNTPVADIADYVLTGTMVTSQAESGSPYSFGDGLRIKLRGEIRYTFQLKEAASGRIVASGTSAGLATRMQSHSYDNEADRLAYHRRIILQQAAQNAAQKLTAQLRGTEQDGTAQDGTPTKDDRSMYQDSPGKRLKAPN